MGTSQSQRARSQGQAGALRADSATLGAQSKAAWQALATEDQLHNGVAEFLNIVLAGQPVFWSGIEHGGYQLGLKGRGKMARHGIKAGLGDIYILHQGRSLWIELKTSKGVVSEAQKMTHNWIRRAGGFVEVCRSVEDVAEVLKRHGVPTIDFRICA